MSVDILMATYNGEKYIRNQILSLQQQTYIDWKLWIRDDGSMDATRAIVDLFSTQDSRIQRVEDKESGLGPGRSFFRLLENADAKYIMFCDQDDMWFEKKLEILVKFAEGNFEENTPCLVYADGYAYSDAEGVVVSQSISHLHAEKIEEFLFFNAGYQGCSMLFNHCLVNMARDYHANFYMHDDVVSLLAHVFGKVFFVPKSLMLYRQHENNVTGRTSKNFLSIGLNFFRRDAFVVSRKHYEEKREFYHTFRERIKPSDQLLFEQYLKYPNVSLCRRLLIVFRNGFSIGGYKIPLLIKTLLRRPLE